MSSSGAPLDSSSASTSSFDTLKSPLEEDEDGRYPDNDRNFNFDPSSHYHHERLHNTDVDREIEEALGGSPIEEDEIDAYYGKSTIRPGSFGAGYAAMTGAKVGRDEQQPNGDSYDENAASEQTSKPTGGNGGDSHSTGLPTTGGSSLATGAISGSSGNTVEGATASGKGDSLLTTSPSAVDSSTPNHIQNHAPNSNLNPPPFMAPITGLGQLPGNSGSVLSTVGLPISGRAKGKGFTSSTSSAGGSGPAVTVKREMEASMLVTLNANTGDASSGIQSGVVPSSSSTVTIAAAGATGRPGMSSKNGDRERSVSGQASGSGSGYVTNNFVAKLFA